MAVKVYLLPLGCAKNMVNAEQMIAQIEQAGMEMVEHPEEADVAVVNTCGFIAAAQEEAIEALLQLAQLKKQGSLKALVASGCLTQRFQKEFFDELPEVDAILGTGSYFDIVDAISAALNGKKSRWVKDQASSPIMAKRSLLGPAYSAYLRVAEGCDNRCAYCVIPFLRGPYRSAPMEQLVDEARWLASQGTKELLVVAQDVSRYGTDLYGKRMLPELLRELCRIDGIHWIRLHYLYPDEMDDELLRTVAQEDKIVKYFDIPIQHIDDGILKAMNRRGNSELIKKLFGKIRSMMPEAVIRTTLIVGFPGEGEQEFSKLYQFLQEQRLERAGVFCYSQEEGSPAARMENQVDEAVKEERRQKLFDLQDSIMDEKSRALVGKTFQLLACGYDESGRQYGRTYMDSPDIDGVVYFDGDVKEGSFVTVKVFHANGCELLGELITL